MKAEDLMIDDWIGVRIQVDDTGTEPVYGEIPLRVTHLMRSNNSIYCDGVSQFDGTEFVPIPLTTEILEKNGFKEDSETNGIYWRPDCRKFCIVKELDTWYFAFRSLGKTVDKSSGYICISECNYVHKLQHILKDLEIDKEIEL